MRPFPLTHRATSPAQSTRPLSVRRLRSLHAALALIALLGTAASPACGEGPRSTSGARDSGAAFDGSEALRWIERQCALGPRVPGTAPHRQCQEMILAYLDSLGLAPETLSFSAQHPRGRGTVEGANLFARVRPGATPRLLLGAHYDTRPWADAELDSSLHERPVLGANDGASGVAVLLVLARIFAETPPPIGIDLAFFDLEDLGSHGAPESFALGSQWLALNYPGPLPAAVLVLDMVGSPTAQFGRELYSWQFSPEWVDLVPQVARRLGHIEWEEAREHAVFDDHLPFLQQGIPSNVIIGFDDPNWHTLRDTPDRVSARTLAHVGEVVLEIVRGGYVSQ